jgi:DNA polymerase-3 subunit delta'
MLFSEILGLDFIKNHLTKSALSGRIPHAQLFIGPEGCGTLAMAIAYAQFVLCRNLETENFGGNDSCNLKFQSLTHPDLHFSFPFSSDKGKIASENLETWRKSFLSNPYIDYNTWMKDLGAEKKQGNIPIAECRDIIKSLSLMAFETVPLNFLQMEVLSCLIDAGVILKP